MPRLLHRLAKFDAFTRQREGLCTQSLKFFLEDVTLRKAFAGLVLPKGLKKSGAKLQWGADNWAPNRARPELEGRDASGKIVVKMTTKFGASLTRDQVETDANELQRRSGEGVLLVLVPRYRLKAAKEILAVAELPDAITCRVWSWERVIELFRKTGCVKLAGDLEQFDAMYRVLSGTDIASLAGNDVLRRWRGSEPQFRDYVDEASRRLSENGRLYPLALASKTAQDREGNSITNAVGADDANDANDGHARVPKGRYLRRYLLNGKPTLPNFYFAIGIRDPFESHQTPIWLRFHAKSGPFVQIGERLRHSPLNSQLVESGGYLWLPIVPQLGEGPAVIESIVEQVRAICKVASGS
ncbi:MAG: hypothetical protein QM784_37975 [Polyangiaceae bacterium]